MPYYELIFENGEHSIACYVDDAEALTAVGEQHRRAIAGEAGGAAGTRHAAQRVKRVLVYDMHPSEYSSQVTVDAAVEALKSKAVGDLVNPMDIPNVMRELASPMVTSAPHESNYKMQEIRELEGWDA